jgi:hypothetical protein
MRQAYSRHNVGFMHRQFDVFVKKLFQKKSCRSRMVLIYLSLFNSLNEMILVQTAISLNRLIINGDFDFQHRQEESK